MTETGINKAGRALVTGASTGIGRAIARELVERGYDVVAADEPETKQAAAELGATAVQVDLATAEGVEELHARAIGAEMGDTQIGQMDDKDDPRQVARDGVEALVAGRAGVVAGSIKNRIQAELGTHLPDAIANPIFARMTKPQGY